MCKRICFFTCLLLILVSGSVFADNTAAMSGGKHDFRSNVSYANATLTGTGSSGEICKACHVPHNAKGSTFLWAQNYDSVNADPGTFSSDLCWGCHDGTMAPYGVAGSPSAPLPDSAKVIKNDPKSHPVNVTYTEPPTPAPLTGTVLRASAGLTVAMLERVGGVNKVTCGSCHDPHAAASNLKMIRGGTNAGSVLCVDCHPK